MVVQLSTGQGYKVRNRLDQQQLYNRANLLADRRARALHTQDNALYLEYLQTQDDLEAFLNPPVGVRLDAQFWGTIRYLEGRLDQLERALLSWAG